MIRYALLALLHERRDYGYNLRRRFVARVGECWQLNVGQVYQTLRVLERTGLVVEVDGVDEEPRRRPDHPARRLYDLTPKGRRYLDRWLRRAVTLPRPVRDELLVRMLVCTPERVQELRDQFAEQERRSRAGLARLLVMRDRAHADGPADLVRRLNFEAAVRHAEAHLGWLEYCDQSLQTLANEMPAAAIA